MAANLAALRAALVHMGTTTDIMNEITATQGINTIEELCILTNDKVEMLCRAIRHPGGLMPNPAFNATGRAAAAVAAGIPVQITNTVEDNNGDCKQFWVSWLDQFPCV